MTTQFEQAILKMKSQPETRQNKAAELIELVIGQDYPGHSQLTEQQVQHVRDTLANGKPASDSDLAAFKRKYDAL